MLKKNLNITIIIFISSITIFTMILFWLTNKNISDFKKSKLILISSIVKGTANQLKIYIEKEKRAVKLFTSREIDTITKLAANPENQTYYKSLKEKVSQYFPYHFAFTISDHTGFSLLYLNESFIGEDCRLDIIKFVGDNPSNNIYIHPKKRTIQAYIDKLKKVPYHFDILNKWKNSNQNGVFFLSFTLKPIIQILEDNTLQGFHLVLVSNKNHQSIEAINSSSAKYFNNLTLSEKLFQETIAKAAIEGSQWLLLGIPDHNLFENYKIKSWQQSTLLLIIFISILFLLFMILYWFQKKQYTLQKQIVESEKKMKHIATHDHLTKIYNRYYIDKSLDKEIEESIHNDSTFSVIIYDLDHFKKINDNYGHDMGDKVLIKTTEIINERIRKFDIFGRWGGEEFLIITPEINKQESVLLAERLRKQLEISDFGIDRQVTGSFGVAEYQAGDNKKTLIKRADNSLYQAKNSGRNKVISI